MCCKARKAEWQKTKKNRLAAIVNYHQSKNCVPSLLGSVRVGQTACDRLAKKEKSKRDRKMHKQRSAVHKTAIVNMQWELAGTKKKLSFYQSYTCTELQTVKSDYSIQVRAKQKRHDKIVADLKRAHNVVVARLTQQLASQTETIADLQSRLQRSATKGRSRTR